MVSFRQPGDSFTRLPSGSPEIRLWRPTIDAHGFPWFPWFPWVPMGSHGSHGVPMGPHGVPMGPHGSPWASMENPRMSEIMDFSETHYSVRKNVGSTGSISIRNMFPLHPVTSKRPESQDGATKIWFFSFSAHGGW